MHNKRLINLSLKIKIPLPAPIDFKIQSKLSIENFKNKMLIHHSFAWIVLSDD